MVQYAVKADVVSSRLVCSNANNNNNRQHKENTSPARHRSPGAHASEAVRLSVPWLCGCLSLPTHDCQVCSAAAAQQAVTTGGTACAVGQGGYLLWQHDTYHTPWIYFENSKGRLCCTRRRATLKRSSSPRYCSNVTIIGTATVCAVWSTSASRIDPALNLHL